RNDETELLRDQLADELAAHLTGLEAHAGEGRTNGFRERRVRRAENAERCTVGEAGGVDDVFDGDRAFDALFLQVIRIRGCGARGVTAHRASHLGFDVDAAAVTGVGNLD